MRNRKYIRLFVDDVLIHHHSFEGFASTLDEVLILLDEAGFIISGAKTKLLHKEQKWLGRLIDGHSSRADPGNIKAIQQMQAPTTYRGLQCLLGALNWIRQYCGPDDGDNVAETSFSHLVKRISVLLRTNKPRDLAVISYDTMSTGRSSL
ncbi:unnamed protein product [Oikopleura dioica]|uniref:ribonuclease H n=1 Tax=Oikopleura dioica TaxID=34765 RepID=E4Z0C2_OIKDI|nr:unnamed protein product [Oikopleura dioica]